MNEETSLEPSTRIRSRARKLSSWLAVLLLMLSFLAGYVPMWLKSSRLEGELFGAQRLMRAEQIQLTLANAALDTRRGEYEAARKGLDSFFNYVTTELDRGIGSALPGEAFYDLQPLLDQRDELSALLARGDPASAERLEAAYLVFRESVSPGNIGPRSDSRDGASLLPPRSSAFNLRPTL